MTGAARSRRTIALCDGRCGSSFRPRGGQARRTAPRPATVAKTAAIARLCAARSPCATVVAPAGYGKTTLLARWAQADPRPFAWVALDGRDDDAVVFLRYIAAAIHGVEPIAARGVRGAVGSRRDGLAQARRAPRERAGGPRAARWCWCSTTCTPSPIRPVWTCSPPWSGTCLRLADRDRQQGGARPAAWALAGAGAAGRDRRGGPPARRAGGRAAAESGRRGAGRERALRTDGADGGLARRSVPRGALVAGRSPELGRAPRASPAKTGSSPTTSVSSCSPGCRRPTRSS